MTPPTSSSPPLLCTTPCVLVAHACRYRILFEYPCEEFTEVYWVKYRSIEAARAARRKMDERLFFSNCLHVCYAPEFETMEETREKLEQRRQVTARRTRCG